MPRLRLAVLTVLSISGAATATIQMDLTVETRTGPDVAVRLSATNHGTETAHDVQPDVQAMGERQSGETVPALAVGAEHVWTLTLPPPTEPGDFPVTIRVRYADANGMPLSALLVHVDHTPAHRPTHVPTALTPLRIAAQGTSALTITNDTTHPLGGRVVIVLPEELTPDPESQAATIAAGGTTRVAFAVENKRAPVGSRYPAYAWFDYRQDGVRCVALATAPLEIIPAVSRAVPLAIAAGAIVVAVLVALVTVRAARGRSAIS